MALGKGLSSLIPDRDPHSAEDVLEQIDSMEFIDDEEKKVQLKAEPITRKRPRKTVELRVEEESEDASEELSSSAVKAPLKKRVRVEEEQEEPAAGAKTGLRERKHVDEAFEEFEELEGDQEIAPPSKPLVTPITFEPEEETEGRGEPGSGFGTVDKQAPAEEEPASFIKRKVATETKRREREGKKHKEKEDITGVEEEEVKDEETEEEISAPSSSETPGVRIWDKHEEHVEHIAIGDIKINPMQPRRKFDPEEMGELQDSIDSHGILQPLVVRRLAEGQGFELVAGERRLRAAKALKWDKVPCVVRRDVKSDQARLVYALVENIQRENLNPIEEAMAYRTLNEEYGLTHEEIGERMSKSRVAITNAVRVLQLPAEIQRGITEGKITVGHARAILMIPDEEKQIRFYRHLVDEGLTVRKAEIRARRIQRTMNLTDPLRRRRRRGRHPLAVQYGPQLEERYGYSATVKHNLELNRFDIIFKAHSDEEAIDLIGRLLGTVELPAENLDEDVIKD